MNPIYCGEFVNNKYEIKDCLEGKQVRIPPEQHLHHERPEWAIVSREAFERAQLLLDERRKQYNPDSAFKDGRHSEKHLFSTLIKCEHCGRSFFQKHYTYVNTRYYWKCQTNDQFTAERCDNRVTVTESDLVSEIRQYLSSLISDKEQFIQSVLSDIEKKQEKTKGFINKTDLQKRIKQLQSKKDKYQEMYAAEVMSMEELKEKTYYINKEIDGLKEQFEQVNLTDKIEKISTEQIWRYTKEIKDFLALENITNGDLRKIISRITVNREGEIKIYLRKFSDLSIA